MLALAFYGRGDRAASTGNFLDVFGLIDNSEEPVQGLNAEPSNGRIERTAVHLEQ